MTRIEEIRREIENNQSEYAKKANGIMRAVEHMRDCRVDEGANEKPTRPE